VEELLHPRQRGSDIEVFDDREEEDRIARRNARGLGVPAIQTKFQEKDVHDRIARRIALYLDKKKMFTKDQKKQKFIQTRQKVHLRYLSHQSGKLRSGMR
jgi:hypothetical protein